MCISVPFIFLLIFLFVSFLGAGEGMDDDDNVVIDVISEEDDTSSTTSGSDGGCTSTSHKFPVVAA